MRSSASGSRRKRWNVWVPSMMPYSSNANCAASRSARKWPSRTAICAALVSSSIQSLDAWTRASRGGPGRSSSSALAPTKKQPPGRIPHASQRSNSARTRGSPRGSRSAGTMTSWTNWRLGLLDHRDLERFLRAEVGEQPALREPGRLGEPPDRQARHADHGRELERSRQDRLPGVLALGHEIRIERSCDLSTLGTLSTWTTWRPARAREVAHLQTAGCLS